MPPTLSIRTTVFRVVLYLEVLFLPNIQVGSEPAPCPPPPPSQLGLQFSVLYYILKFSSSLIYRQVLSQPRAPPLSIRTTVFGVVLYLQVLFLPNIQAGSEPAPCPPPPSQLGLQFSVLYYILKFSSSLIYRQVLSQPRAPPLSIRTTVFGVVLYLEVLFLPNIQAGSEPAPCPPPPTLSIRTTVFGVVLYLEVLFLPNIQAGSEPAPCPPPSQLGLQFSVLYYIFKFFLPNIQAGSEPAPCPHPSQLGLQFSVLYYILKFSSSLIYRQVLSQPRAPPLN